MPQVIKGQRESKGKLQHGDSAGYNLKVLENHKCWNFFGVLLFQFGIIKEQEVCFVNILGNLWASQADVTVTRAKAEGTGGALTLAHQVDPSVSLPARVPVYSKLYVSLM